MEVYEHECKQCGYGWSSTHQNPSTCPSCGSVNFNKSKSEHHCLRCDYKWSTLTKRAWMCPNCKTTVWDRVHYEHHCLRCNHVWKTLNEIPAKCAKCQNPKWDTPKNIRNSPLEIIDGSTNQVVCHRKGCTSPATETHSAYDIPVCGAHVNKMGFSLFMHPNKQANKGNGSIIRISKVKIQERWVDLRTDIYGLSEQVVIKNPVNWCEKCGAGISRVYRYCKPCFQKLPQPERSAEMIRFYTLINDRKRYNRSDGNK